MAKLIYQDPDSGQEVSVDIGPDFPEVTIGRNPGNIVRINNPSISRKHAKLVHEGGQVTLYDLNSSNGSYVNGNRVQNQVLADGDRIRVGEFPIDFVEQGAVQQDQLQVGPIDELPEAGAEPNRQPQQGPSGGVASSQGTHQGQGLAEATGEAPDSNAPVQFGGGESDDDAMMLGDDDFEEIADQAVSDALADGGDPEPFGGDPDTATESPRSGDQIYDDTTNAPPEEIARGLAASAYAGKDEGEVESLREENQQLREENERLREENERLGEENQQLDDQLSQVRERLEEAPDAELVDRLEDDLESARRDVEMRDETIDALQDEVEQLEMQLDELEAAQAEGDTLREDHGGTEELIEQIGELKAEREQLRERVEELEADQAKKKEIFEELSSDLRDLVARNRELEEALAGLQEGSSSRGAAAEG
ncbi:MAG: FHA domain-containing protein [Persicimonas sp.]